MMIKHAFVTVNHDDVQPYRFHQWFPIT